MNRVFLHGRVGKKPDDLRYAPSGTAVLKFSMVTTEYTGSGEDRKEISTWHNIVCFGKQATAIAEHVDQGQMLVVEGSLRENKWETQEGEKRSRMEIIIDRFEFGARPKGSSNGSGSRQREDRAPESAPEPEEAPWS